MKQHLHCVIILAIYVIVTSQAANHGSQLRNSRSQRLRPTQETLAVHNTRHKNRNRDRHHGRDRLFIDIQDGSKDSQDKYDSIQDRSKSNPGSFKNTPGSAANHEPLYGSEPPAVAIADQDYPLKSGSKSHLVNDPHELLYSDQYVGENKDQISLRRSAELANNRVKIDNPREELVSHLSKESLSLDNAATEQNWNERIEVTTEGQVNYLNSQEYVENSVELENQGKWDDPDFLKDLVMDLQEQLRESKTSQRVTRSVLNTIQEKQNAQAIDLQIVKNEVVNIRKEQLEQKQTLVALQEQVSNNMWGVRDVKDAHDQTKLDLRALKDLQLAHNDTMIILSDLSESNAVEHTEHSHAIRYLQHEMLGLRTQLEQDRTIIYSLQEILLEQERSGGYAHENYGREIHNNIPVIPSLTDDVSRESSGDGSRSQEFLNFDELASSIEEKHNVIGDHLSRIIAREERVDQDLSRMRNRFSFYDNKMAQLNSLYLNTSLQLAHIERTLLANQNQYSQSGLTSLQEMASQLMNFTAQLVTLQQWHMSSKSNVNTTWGNQKQLGDLQNNLDSLSSRIKELENRAKDHRTHSNDNFSGLRERLEDLERTVLQCNVRVSDLQIKILNTSLTKCEKIGKSYKQEQQIQELDRGLSKVEHHIENQGDKMSKIERGMSKLFELSDKQGHALGHVMGTVQDVGSILPSITNLQTDMQNLLSQLPADCSELLLVDESTQNGVYLVHPRGSTNSVQLACQFQDAVAWTVIQKRFNGNISFARTWEEYKYGFGNPQIEFWIGNENLHFLTSQDNYQLQIDMTDLEGNHWSATYDVFNVGDEESMYILDIDGYHGNATDAFRYSNGMPFSSIDVDNDVSSTNCAKFYTAGWWYKHCHYANLNGRFTVGIVWFNHNQDEWVQMKETVMKIRPLKT